MPGGRNGLFRTEHGYRISARYGYADETIVGSDVGYDVNGVVRVGASASARRGTPAGRALRDFPDVHGHHCGAVVRKGNSAYGAEFRRPGQGHETVGD